MKNKIRHIALIPDGNYRFALKKNITYQQALEAGMKKIDKFIVWCHKQGIPEVTIWVCSTENRKRSKRKTVPLFDCIKKRYKAYKHEQRTGLVTDDMARYADYDVQFVGQLEALPTEARAIAREFKQHSVLKKKSATKKCMKVNLALNYGGKEELFLAAKALVADVVSGKISRENLVPASFSSRLMIHNDIDMIVRFGKEKRTSGFFPWQSAYAEFFFVNKLWPEATTADFAKQLDAYQQRKRRYGL